MSAALPDPDELERYVKHGMGLGYVHGQRVNRRVPCGTYVWPDDESVQTATTGPRGAPTTCPRCLAAMGAK